MSSASKYSPMLPKPGRYFPERDTLYEQKYDGVRILAGKDERASVELVSRGNKDLTAAFPELVAALERTRGRFVVDGEACVFTNGKPNLGAVNSRIKSMRPSRRHWKIIPDPPAILFLFDLLEFNGKDWRRRPIEERKACLKRVFARPQEHIRCVEYVTSHGAQLYAEAKRLGLEGIVCKQAGSLYVGTRSDKWLKFKVPGYRPLKYIPIRC